MQVLQFLLIHALLAGALISAQAVSPALPDSAIPLPVRKVVLYKNGVGYFEHIGRVRGSQEFTISFTSSQLNDVLKSLTVMDRGQGRVTSVRYDSTAPVGVRMRGLGLPLTEQASRDDVLSALRGVRVEVRSGANTVTGRLLSVEERAVIGERGETSRITELSLVTDNGGIHLLELKPGASVRVLERDSATELGRYLDLVNSARSRDLRRMVVSTSGAGERDLFVSYISEVPVWKSTYRIVLGADKPLLQGWAIIDNTVGEDWSNVQLSLVAGAPQSFVQDISQPYYTRRPSVPLPASVLLTPQTHEGTLEAQEAKTSVGAGQGGGIGSGMAGVVGGIMAPTPANRDEVRRHGAVAAPPPPMNGRNLDRLQANQTVDVEASAFSVESQAYGLELGDQFSYELKQPITIGKDQSALVPILEEDIDAEKITLWNSRSKSPLRALWIKNNSGLTLDSGSFNVVEAGAFAGEGVLDTLKPSERRLLSYAADTGVRVDPSRVSPRGPVSRVRIVKGLMSLTRERHESNVYTVHNADTSSRQVVIEHPARNGWKLQSTLRPEETTASFYRFLVAVAPGKTEKLTVNELYPEVSSYQLSNITADQISLWVSERTLNPKLEQVFRELLTKKAEIAQVDSELKTREQEVQSITADQNRVRENMKALKGSSEEKELLRRYTRQLDSQEDRLATLRTELANFQAQRQQLSDELDARMMTISVDETLQAENREP